MIPHFCNLLDRGAVGVPLRGATHTHYSLGVLLDNPSGVLHILTAPLGCYLSGHLTGYTLGVLLGYLLGVLHLPTSYTLGMLLDYL